MLAGWSILEYLGALMTGFRIQCFNIQYFTSRNRAFAMGLKLQPRLRVIYNPLRPVPDLHGCPRMKLQSLFITDWLRATQCAYPPRFLFFAMRVLSSEEAAALQLY